MGLALVLVGTGTRASEGDGLDAPPPPPAPTPAAGVEITVADSISDAETIRGWIEERAASVLGDSERALERGEVIHIAVRGRAFAYEIEVVLVHHGQALDGLRQPRPFACECGNQELLDRIGEAVVAGTKVLGEEAEREREDAARAEAERREREERQRQEAERAEAEQRTRYRPSVLGRAGIGALGAGGAVALGGIIMAVQPPQQVNGYAYERDWSRPGYAVIGIGSTAVAVGVTVLIVDVVRCRRDRSRCGATVATQSIEGTRWAGREHGGMR